MRKNSDLPILRFIFQPVPTRNKRLKLFDTNWVEAYQYYHNDNDHHHHDHHHDHHPDHHPHHHHHFWASGGLIRAQKLKCQRQKKGLKTVMVISSKEAFWGVTGLFLVEMDKFWFCKEEIHQKLISNEFPFIQNKHLTVPSKVTPVTAEKAS